MSEKTFTFRTHGLDYADEVAILKRDVGPLVGGAQHLEFGILNGRVTVTPPPAHVSSFDMIKKQRIPNDDRNT